MHRRMTVAALMAAAALICFVYLRIEVPMAFGLTGKVYFGYTFILIGALLTGRWYGALAGAVGLTMADLLAGYVTSALPTFLSFALLGYLAGAGADWWRARYGETKWMALTVSAVAFTIFAFVEPLIRSTFKYFVLGYPFPMAVGSAGNVFIASVLCAPATFILLAVLYPAVRRALPELTQALIRDRSKMQKSAAATTRV